LPYKLAGTIRLLAPPRSIWGKTPEEFTRLYREHLELHADTIHERL
jgi:hypothetical protein